MKAPAFLDKPILKTTISDYAKIMNEIARKNKNVALDFAYDGIRNNIDVKTIRSMDPDNTVFMKNGRFTEKAKFNIINALRYAGIRSRNEYKDITGKDYVNMILNQIEKTEKNVDYYI